MSRMRGWLEVLRAVFRRGQVDREMEEEFRYHLERQVEANVARGLSPDAARAAALRSFGGEDRYAEATRDARGVRWLDDLRSDLRLAVRGMRRAPGSSVVAVLTLGLGIGATIAIFSIVNGVLLEPLPYADADRIVSVWGRFEPESGFDFERFVLSPPELADYTAQNTVMETIGGYATSSGTLVDDAGEALRVAGTAATAEVFDVLGVPPLLGRVYGADEDDPGGAQIAVLSYGLWQSAFAGDPAIIGRLVRLNGRETEVIGVMPAGFSFPGEDRQVYVPLRIQYPGGRASHFFSGIARLKAGATLEQAESEMAGLMELWKRDYPDIHTGHYLFLRRYVEDVVGDAPRLLALLMGAVGIVLLLVCVNVAHVLLARSVARRRELAVCAALGASRRRLARQTLAESGVLAVTGTVLGLLLARVSLHSILELAGSAVPRPGSVHMNGRVALAAVGIAALVTLVAGLLPALRARLADPQMALRDGDRSSTGGPGGSRLRGALVVAEVALATIIVAAAALLVRSYDHLLSVDPGFRTEQALMVDLSLPSGIYQDPESRYAFYRDLRTRLAALPGVTDVGGASFLPLTGIQSNIDFEIENRPPPAPGEPATSSTFLLATPGLDRALGIEMLEGRFIDEADDADATRVVVVSRALERRFFPDGALGRRMRLSGDTTGWMTIVGVIADVPHEGLDVAPVPAYYVAYAQSLLVYGYPPTRMVQVLRTQTDPLALAPAIREVVRAIDPGLPITRMDPLHRVIEDSVARPRFTLSLVGSFAVLALVLGGLGLYGVLACAVSERIRELGIRMALGARRGEVARLVIGRGLLLTAIGLALGLGAALAGGRVLTSMLYDVTPTDPATFAVTAATLLGIALLACLVPASRALRLDPAEILRNG